MIGPATQAVASSIAASSRSASARVLPHIIGSARKLLQTAGRSGLPNSRQRFAESS